MSTLPKDPRGARREVRVHQGPARQAALGFESSGLLAQRLTAPSRTFGSIEEFLDGLRRLRTHTGMSFRQIEQHTQGRLPRATAQAMVAARKTTLPARGDQVVLFVGACGGSNLDQGLWVDQWRRLRGAAAGAKPDDLPKPLLQYELVAAPEPEPRPRSWWQRLPARRRRVILELLNAKRLTIWLCWTAVVAVTVYLAAR